MRKGGGFSSFHLCSGLGCLHIVLFRGGSGEEGATSSSGSPRYSCPCLTVWIGLAPVWLGRDKKQVSSDHVESGRYQASDIDCGRDHPWKLKNRWSNSFRSEEREEYDAAFFHISGEWPLSCTPYLGRLVRVELCFAAFEPN